MDDALTPEAQKAVDYANGRISYKELAGTPTTGNAFADLNSRVSAFVESGNNDGSILTSQASSPFESHLISAGLAPAMGGLIQRKDVLRAFKETKDTEGARPYMDVDSMGKMATQLQQQAKLAGVNWSNKGGDSKSHIVNAAFALQEMGVKDIKSLRKEGDKWYQTVGGKKQEVKFNGDEVAASAEGDGFTRYKVQADAQGRPIFYSTWESSTDKGKIAAGLGLMLNFVAPGAGTALGNAVGLTGGVATAVGSGVIQGGLAAAGGANGEGILRSALSAGAAPALAAVPGFSALPALTKKILAGAASGAIKSDSSKGALLGAVTGSIPGNMTGNGAIDRLLKAIISNQVQKKVMKP
jgi:hypothetical protein